MNYSYSTFDFIPCGMTRKCMQNGCWALDQTNMWDWLRAYEVDPTKGFMFSTNPEIYIIGKQLDNGSIIKLSDEDKELCRKHKLKYVKS